MTLRIVGAGLPRTGTMSLKAALERLLGAPCYHMTELFDRPEHAPVWRDAFAGTLPDWDVLLAGYAAAVDTPACRFWRELSATYPDAPVLLSRRESAEVWYASMDKTVLAQARRARDTGFAPPGGTENAAPSPWSASTTPTQRDAWRGMFQAMLPLFGSLDDPEVAMRTYDRWLADVRAAVPPERLVEWQPGDGWQPLCTALGLPVPDEDFPHENSTAAFTARVDGASPPPT